MYNVIRWTSIEQLRHVRAWLQSRVEVGVSADLPDIAYRAKVKLHGTNAGVQILPDGTVVPQGRNRVLSAEDPHQGFATWVLDNRGAFAALAQAEHTLVLYGEWCGPGIQRKVAISRIDRKVLAVYAIQRMRPGDEDDAELLVDPDLIAAYIPDLPDLFVLPWHGAVRVLPFGDEAALARAGDAIAAEVEAVEARDPWVAERFGVEGVGEGLVLYPVPVDGSPAGWQPREHVTRRIWKAKGLEHKVTRADRVVQIDPVVVASIEAFVDTFVTEPRLEQAVVEVFGSASAPLDRRGMGPFLQWIGRDVQKESQLELQAADLTWKQVGKAVGQRARDWYLARTR